MIEDDRQNKGENIPSSSEVLFFEPNENGHDRFGNRLFSEEVIFHDVDGKPQKSSMLVTPNGELFLQYNPGIVKDIDHALQTAIQALKPEDIVDLPDTETSIPSARTTESPHRILSVPRDHRTIEYFRSGNSSHAFKLYMEHATYVIKVRRGGRDTPHDSELYSSELLQLAQLHEELSDDFLDTGLRLPSVLFSTPNLICMQYEDGTNALTLPDPAPFVAIFRAAEQFVDGKRDMGDPLWEGIHIDWKSDQEDDLKKITQQNIIQTKEDFVWIDPFYRAETDSR